MTGAPRIASRVRPLLPAAPWLLLAVPVGLWLWTRVALNQNYFAAPFFDQWENVYHWRRLIEGEELTLSFLFSQHNEHRIPLPRLLYFADLKWFRGTSLLNLTATAVIQLLSALLLVLLAQPRRLTPLGVLALAVALGLIFSAAQWENLFWGFQVQFVGVFAAGAWGIHLYSQGASRAGSARWMAVAAALLLLAAATFTMANGLFAGLAMVLIGLATRRAPRTVLAAAAATTVLLALYLWGYRPTPHPPAPEPVALRWLEFVLAFLGNVWALGQTELAMLAGVAGVALSMAMFVVTFRQPVRDPARIALVGIVLFIGMSIAVTAFGRVSYGVRQALAPRYVTPTVWFWAAQALFWGLTLQDLPSRAWTRLFGATLILALVALPVVQWKGLRSLEGLRERILLGSSALVGRIHDDKALARLYPDAGRVREFAGFLRTHQLGVFARDPGFVAGDMAPASRIGEARACLGALDLIDRDPDGGNTLRAVGWGWDREADDPYSRVLLVEAGGRILGVAVGGGSRPDVSRAVPEVGRSPGWMGLLSPTSAPEIGAYGVRSNGSFCELGRKAPPP